MQYTVHTGYISLRNAFLQLLPSCMNCYCCCCCCFGAITIMTMLHIHTGLIERPLHIHARIAFIPNLHRSNITRKAKKYAENDRTMFSVNLWISVCRTNGQRSFFGRNEINLYSMEKQRKEFLCRISALFVAPQIFSVARIKTESNVKLFSSLSPIQKWSHTKKREKNGDPPALETRNSLHFYRNFTSFD